MKRTMTAIALAALCMTNFTLVQGKPVEKSAGDRQTTSQALGQDLTSQTLIVAFHKNQDGMTTGVYRPPGRHNPLDPRQSPRQDGNPARGIGSNVNHGTVGDTAVPQLRAGDGSGVPNPNPPPCCRV